MLNSAQMLAGTYVFQISVSTGSEVDTIDNPTHHTYMHFIGPRQRWNINLAIYLI